jgi:ribosomal protein S18 acetylase RimI-like enzyme
MGYRIRRSSDLELVEALHAKIFPGDEMVGPEHVHWVAYGPPEWPEAVGFCSARHLADEDAVFLSRAGVLRAASGAGLQRRMIDVRVRFARQLGVKNVITYVKRNNFRSAANLIRSGFHFYEPAYEWGLKGALYFIKTL